jgi:hypothetical protein
MAKLEKGQKMVCVPCGREVIVNSCGVSEATLFCCDTAMKTKTKKPAARKAKKK